MKQRMKEEQKIKVKIVSLDSGLTEYEDVEMVWVKSSHHNILIMKNYMPILGELDGLIEVVFEDYTIRFDGLKGYYMHKKNEFCLLVQEGETVPERVQEDEEYAQ